MRFRSISIVVALAAFGTLDLAHATDEAPLSYEKGNRTLSLGTDTSTYRQYVNAQAATLVGMTKVLAGEIRNGNLAAAQMAYAPAHRYFKRIEPAARLLQDLRVRVDARADAFDGKEADRRFSGFHRIEYGLFANGSTAGLSDHADRLDKDARELRTRLAFLSMAPDALLEKTAEILGRKTEIGLAGDEERYSRTDLWDLEASLDGARHVVDLVQPGLDTKAQDKDGPGPLTIDFAALDALLEKQKLGCGFKNYDELSRDEKAAFTIASRALAAKLVALRTHVPSASALDVETRARN